VAIGKPHSGFGYAFKTLFKRGMPGRGWAVDERRGAHWIELSRHPSKKEAGAALRRRMTIEPVDRDGLRVRRMRRADG
jgi:hypothetical protein